MQAKSRNYFQLNDVIVEIISFFSCYFLTKYFKKIKKLTHIRNIFSLLYLHKVIFMMDFISKHQGRLPLKFVPYIFFIAVVLSITTSTNTFI